MGWRIELAKTAEKQLEKLGRENARRITQFLRHRVAALDDPRQIGTALAGSHSGLWRYRIGDYRVICDIRDSALVVLVVEIGHRREVYR